MTEIPTASLGLVVAIVVAAIILVAIVLVAMQAPELRRYMKIRSM